MALTIPECLERRVLLAGSSSRLLPGMAAGLEAEGARVVLADPAPPADLAVPTSVARITGSHAAIEGAIESLGGLDLLVCHAGPGTAATVLDADPRAWRLEVDDLVGRAFELSQTGARAMLGRGGVIVHVIGPDALHAYSGRSIAATGFAAIVGIIRALAVELATAGIRVVGVMHGPLESGAVGASAKTSGDNATETILRAPNGHFGTPADVEAAVRFVAGPRASFMTGQMIRVDGGWGSLNQAPAGLRFP